MTKESHAETARCAAPPKQQPDVLSAIVSFTAVAALVVLMPGADTVLVLRTSLRDGTRAGVLTAIGVSCGPIIWGALAGVGAALVLRQQPAVSSIVSAAGGVYLGFLAITALRSAVASWRSSAVDSPGTALAAAHAHSARLPFVTGLMTNLLNPKIGIFYLSVMPGLFLGQEISAWLGALLGTIHAALGLCFLSTIAALSGFAGAQITRPKVQATIELVCALCLFGFALYALGAAAAQGGLFPGPA